MDRTDRRAAALAALRERWGAAAPRPATEVFGALAIAPTAVSVTVPVPGPRPLPAEPGEIPGLDDIPGSGLLPAPVARPGIVALPGRAPVSLASCPAPVPDEIGRVVPTGFADLDVLLAIGGLPRPGSVALRGAGSSGATTLALRAVGEAQAGGALVAWVDLPRSLDPVEAVARGVRLEWLVVLVPDGPAEALAMAGTLLQARVVDILVLDLGEGRRGVARDPGAGASTRGGLRPAPRPADQLARLLAFARRAGALLLVLEPPDLPAGLRDALAGVGLRLELRRCSWIRLGREVVGQRTEVRVERDRHGAPDRRAELRILYAEGGGRDRCLRRPDLLDTAPGARDGRDAAASPILARFPPTAHGPPGSSHGPVHPSAHQFPVAADAPPPPLLVAPPPPARAHAGPRARDDRAARPRRAAVG